MASWEQGVGQPFRAEKKGPDRLETRLFDGAIVPSWQGSAKVLIFATDGKARLTFCCCRVV